MGLSARSFDLARPGVAPPLLMKLIVLFVETFRLVPIHITVISKETENSEQLVGLTVKQTKCYFYYHRHSHPHHLFTANKAAHSIQ